MKKYRWTGVLFLIGAISAIILYFMSKLEDFPQQVMLVFWPAQYAWDELRGEFNVRIIRAIVGNVSVFGILAGLEGALAGLILDSYVASRRAALNWRLGRLPPRRAPLDLAMKRRVQEILAKYNPAGLSKEDTSGGGYAAQTKVIMAKLGKLGSPRKLSSFCRQEFPRQLGRKNTKAFKEYGPLAREIWKAYLRGQSEERRTPPGQRRAVNLDPPKLYYNPSSYVPLQLQKVQD